MHPHPDLTVAFVVLLLLLLQLYNGIEYYDSDDVGLSFIVRWPSSLLPRWEGNQEEEKEQNKERGAGSNKKKWNDGNKIAAGGQIARVDAS
jgi:hypothetical protein